MAGFFSGMGGGGQGMNPNPGDPNYDPNNPVGSDPYGGNYYDPGGGYGQDPASYMGNYGNPIDAAQNAVDPGSVSGGNQSASDVGSGVQSGPAGPGGGGNQLSQLLAGYPNLMMQAGGGGRRAPPAPGQPTAPAWMQPNAMEPNRWEQGDPSRWGGPNYAGSGYGPYQPVTPAAAPARARPRAAPVPIPQPRPAAADYDPSTDPNPAAGSNAYDPATYGGSASPDPNEQATSGLPTTAPGPGTPTPEMLQQPNFAPYNPATDPTGVGTSIPGPQSGASGSWTDPGASGTWNQPYVPPSQTTFNPLNQPTGASVAGTSQPSNAITDPALMMQADGGPTNITTDSSDPRVQQAVSNLTGAQAPNAPGGSNLPGGHVPTTAGGTTGQPPAPSPGESGLPGGHVPSSAATEQPQPQGAAGTPGPAGQPGADGYDPATGQPYPTNQQGQQFGGLNPMKMLFDMLFGGPQALLQDLAGLAGQAGYGQGGQGYNPANDPMGAGQSQAPWLAQGQAAPQGTNPYNYPMAPQGSRFVPGRGLLDAQNRPVQGQPGTQSGAAARAGAGGTPGTTGTAGATGDTFTPRANQGLTNEVAANTPVSGEAGATPQGAAPMSAPGAYHIPPNSMAARMGATGRPSQPNVDIAPLASEAGNDRLAYQAAQMVDQEVTIGPGPVSTRAQIAQLETARNRALYGIQGNGRFPDGTRAPRSMAESLQMVGQPHGYYPNYMRHRISPMAFMKFKQQVWDPVMRQGINTTDIGWGPMTGNASDQPGNAVASHQFGRGQLGYKLAGGDTYFREHVGRGHGLPTMPGQGTQVASASRFAEGLNLPPTVSPRTALANRAYENMPRWEQGVYGQFRRSGDVEDRRGESQGASVAREIGQRNQGPGRMPMRGGVWNDPNDPMAVGLGIRDLGPRGPRRSRQREAGPTS